MTIEKVIEHIFYTPYNTNKAILTSMLKQLILSYGGNPEGQMNLVSCLNILFMMAVLKHENIY